MVELGTEPSERRKIEEVEKLGCHVVHVFMALFKLLLQLYDGRALTCVLHCRPACDAAALYISAWPMPERKLYSILETISITFLHPTYYIYPSYATCPVQASSFVVLNKFDNLVIKPQLPNAGICAIRVCQCLAPSTSKTI